MMMKITFIRPAMSAVRSSDAMQPLAFAVLAGLTQPDIELTLFDERIEAVDMEADTDLVAMTVETCTARRAYEIAGRYRKRGISVVMGGYHPTFLPAEALEFADSVVIGDAEGLWERVVDDVQKNQLQAVYKLSATPHTTQFNFDRSIFNGKKYTRLLPVQYGRGCRYACDFCSIHAFYGTNLRQRPLDELLAEIESLDSKYIMFVDDNLFVDAATTETFLHAIKDLNIRWSCQISIDIAQKPKLLDLMAESGCMLTLIGLESLNKANLRQMNKHWVLKQPGYATSLKLIRERGIMISGTFVLGYDADTPDTFKTTLDFAMENKFCLANFNPLMPIPGTRLYERLQDEKRLIYDQWWLDPHHTYGEATFIPRGMSPDQLTEGCYWARTQFNTCGAIFKRSLEPQANARSLSNLGVFLAANLVSRREIHKKQGRYLGTQANSLNEDMP